MMHSKETVWYVRRRYVRGETHYDYFYKRELLTTDSYRDLDSVYWSDEKPVTERTFRKACKDGYKCDSYCIYLPPVELITLPERSEDDGEIRPDRRPSQRRGTLVSLLCHRLRKPVGLRRVRRATRQASP